jgi:peptidase propeptide and YPEB domain
MYALGLPHTFYEDQFVNNQKHLFSKYKTNNYMDYSKEKKTTFKWQWELVRASKLIEKQLPLFSILLFFLLFSCKGYKSIPNECDYNYFPTKEEMVLDSLTYPLEEKVVIGNKTYRNFKSSFNKNVNYLTIDIDTLGVILTKYIDFNNGKIKLTNFTISKSGNIGKEYHFDENGNVTKVIDNDEGFAICWQQALFIAKKNTGKKAKEWKISKDFDDDKNKKYWEVYYFEDRDRFLVIDAQTGKIVKRGLSGISTDDVIYDDTFKSGDL